MTASFWHSDLFFDILHYYLLLSVIICFLVICSANAAYAVLCLVALFILVSFIFIFIGAEYVGLVFVIVYVGAIAVLFLFIIMLLDLRNLVYQQFTAFVCMIFSLSIMLTSDTLLYILDFSHLPFLCLPLIPVSVLVDLCVDGYAVPDNLVTISPSLFNLHGYYVLGCGFILAFVMIGVVLMLSQTLYLRNEHFRARNKITVRSNIVVTKTFFN